MPKSLKAKFKSLRYRCLIDDAEYRSMCKKLDGHDKELLNELNNFLVEEKGEYVGSDIAEFLAIRKGQNGL